MTAAARQDDDYASLVWPGAPLGELYHRVADRPGAVVLRPSVDGGAVPADGAEVTCRLPSAEFRGRVTVGRDGSVTVTAPAWIRRPAQRGSQRVTTDVPVELEFRGPAVAGRLSDLSVGGCACVVETSLPFPVGARVRCHLPVGVAEAEVRSRRPHEHRLLTVLGLAWGERDAAARGWIADTVTRQRSMRSPAS